MTEIDPHDLSTEQARPTVERHRQEKSAGSQGSPKPANEVRIREHASVRSENPRYPYYY